MAISKIKKRNRRIYIILILIFCIQQIGICQDQDSTFKKLNQLRDNFISEIKKLGFTPGLKSPEVIIDSPASFATLGTYNDSTNTIHTSGDWKTVPTWFKNIFNFSATKMKNGETGESFFNKSVHQWIFIHELGHWWRACQHQEATFYDEEKAADRIDIAYWRLMDSVYMNFMAGVFQKQFDQFNPLPAGQNPRQYLNDHYETIIRTPLYNWYQSQMITTAYNERPISPFSKVIADSGNLK
jgi:hypothetical protein